MSVKIAEDLPPLLEEARKHLFTTNEFGYEYQVADAAMPDSLKRALGQTYGIRVDVHDMCVNCQTRQIMKYWNDRDVETNELCRTFGIKCDFVQRALPPGSAEVYDDMVRQRDIDPKIALKIIKAPYDPVSWAELMFGFDDDSIGTDNEWYLRPYQKEQLRCNGRQLVIREGRRTGKTFISALKLLFLAFNTKLKQGINPETGRVILAGPQIMVITPYQAQLVNIFDEMEKLLKRSKELSSRIASSKGGGLYIKTPHFHMLFEGTEDAPGAAIRGFVSGIGVKADGSAGGTIRGQNAQVIYLDEMDMIPEEVMDKVVVPLTLTPHFRSLIGTSTPIGKRGWFYKWCQESPDFKEDYLPSTVLPNWESMKRLIMGESSKEGFAAEYMAKFIDGSFGVFKPTLLYQARKPYFYEQCGPEKMGWWREFAGVQHIHELVKIMGIDWNKNAGTEFVVVAFDPNSGRWIVCDAVNMEASEFSSVTWQQEVVRLNAKWKLDYIYADEGWGHHIIEDLKYHAHKLKGKPKKDRMETATARLADILVSYNFSQKVELRSPVDGKTMTKSGKEYLVENAVRVFEHGRIWLPENDEALFKQLENYTVIRRTPTTNKPIYGPAIDSVGDHRLDALMLALAGLSLEFGPYSGKMASQSKPSAFSKDALEARGEAALSPALQKMRELEQSGFHQTDLQTFSGSRHPHAAPLELPKTPKHLQKTRRRGEELREKSVFETLYEQAHNTAGFESDLESYYNFTTPRVVTRRQPRARSRSGRASMRRRRR